MVQLLPQLAVVLPLVQSSTSFVLLGGSSICTTTALRAASDAPRGFGRVQKPKPAPATGPRGNNRPLDTKLKAELVKRMALKFIDLKNSGDWDTIVKLCADDVDVYGTVGREPAAKALKDFAATHPQLHHALRDETVAVLAPGKVGYVFTKSWVDPATGEARDWVSFEESRRKMETLEFFADGRIKRMAIETYDAWPPEGATLL
ncbi:hypothetical protein JKP88DRAFT_218942 [Tribonema minus]|uniref:SnoaL-like domain-containing protein n=1 Tax=Tribonema minus TaxID=303371 RepID=A0A835Z482_9STRA|nr:hypothetical protein JKP88DRAFT_218942 [Tribonema minus]